MDNSPFQKTRELAEQYWRIARESTQKYWPIARDAGVAGWNRARRRATDLWWQLGLDRFRYFGQHRGSVTSRTVFAALGTAVILGAGLTAIGAGSATSDGPAATQEQRQAARAERDQARTQGGGDKPAEAPAAPDSNAAKKQQPKPDWIRPSTEEISDVFGPRDWRAGQMHDGMDYAAEEGDVNYAAADGKVVQAGPNGGFGNLVVIDHGGGVQTWYGHHSKIGVKVGQKVSVGDPIGEAGSTGDITGPHLHFEVHVDGSPIDPMKYLKDHGVKF